MHAYQREFLRFAIAQGVLRFGSFTLKSGRVSPYFFNAGGFDSGASLARLGRFYAEAALTAGLKFDLLYGPAYKGIPLAAATAIALADHHDRDLPWAFNRKEAKDHGEGGSIVGSPLAGRVLIIDDVITAGTSVGESVALIEAAGARPAAVLIALDRRERGPAAAVATGPDGPPDPDSAPRSAVDEVRDRYGLTVTAIVTLDDLIAFLGETAGMTGTLAAMRRYRDRYGVI